MANMKGNGGVPAEEAPSSASASTSPVGDALLLTTLSTIGLPVEVQVKDGSVYSGVFHTARADKDYAIVLKKAKKICMGGCNANLELGILIDTLVVLSDDLVQVIAKDVPLPGEEVNSHYSTDVADYVSEDVGSVDCDNAMDENMKARTSHQASGTINLYQNNERPGDAIITRCLDAGKLPTNPLPDVEDGNLDTVSFEVKGASASHPVTKRQVVENGAKEIISSVYAEGITSETIEDNVQSKQSAPVLTMEKIIYPVEKSLKGREIPENVISLDGHTTGSINKADCCARLTVRQETSVSDLSTSPASAFPNLYAPCSTSSMSMASTNIPASLKDKVEASKQKVFKLNPGAKTFMPSYSQPGYAAPVGAPSTTLNVASAPFVPANVTSFMSIGGMQPAVETGTLSNRTSPPMKFAVYNNHSPADYTNFQYPRPVITYANTRSSLTTSNAQQYLPVQIGAGYPHPNPQTHLYMQHAPQESIHWAMPELTPSCLPPPPPSLPRPLLNLYQYNPPKLQQPPAALQLCTVPPIMTGQPQLYAPFAHPVHMMQTASVPGANGAFGNKFYL